MFDNFFQFIFDDYSPKNIRAEFYKLRESNLTRRDSDTIIVEPDFPVYILQTVETGTHKIQLTEIKYVNRMSEQIMSKWKKKIDIIKNY